NMAEHFDLEAMGHNTAEYVHTMVELKKLAFTDRDRYVADPFFVDVPVERLISESYAADLADGVGERATTPESRDDSNDTVYLAVVDSAGNAVSLIESLFSMFGSGRMVPGTGIILQNRGSLFTLDPAHPNLLAPGKRPYHTLSPSMVLHPDGSLFMVFGTPGGDGQTQTLAQVFNNIVLFGMTPQQAIEAPRWRSYSGGRLALEPDYGQEVASALAALGHDVDLRDSYSSAFGGAQVILVDRSGALRTGADFRREGYAVAW
ncbi:MAG: gamma-glutamyltransferase, partial [Longimicrobiales bacterium]